MASVVTAYHLQGYIHPFVDGFIAKNYAGQEKEIFEKLSKSQPIGRMGTSEESASHGFILVFR
jgi:hypothetical protein